MECDWLFNLYKALLKKMVIFLVELETPLDNYCDDLSVFIFDVIKYFSREYFIVFVNWMSGALDI